MLEDNNPGQPDLTSGAAKQENFLLMSFLSHPSRVLMGPQVLRVLLDLVVLLVCLVSVEREASLVFLDLL